MDSVVSQEFSTCSCWTKACGYCSNVECTLKQDLQSSNLGIPVQSWIKKGKYNAIMFYDEDGNKIGKFQFSKRRIHLTGCVACGTSKYFKGKCILDAMNAWAVSIADGILKIRIGGIVVYENELKRECKKRYGKAKRFSFYSVQGDNSFSFVPEEMEAGNMITSTGCAALG